MTSRTVTGKPALMWVSMATRAFGEVQARISSRCRRFIRGVALLAGHNLVCSSQRKAGELVVESNDRLPGIRCVARCAVRTELAAMRIDVARAALGPQPQERFVQVLRQDLLFFFRRDGFLVVTLPTFQNFM